MDQSSLEAKTSKKLKEFIALMINPNWAHKASKETLDYVFKCILDLEEIFIQDKKGLLKQSVLKNYPCTSINKFLNVVVENFIKNRLLDEHLTLHAINNCRLIYSDADFSKTLEKILPEIELRGYMYKLIEDFPDTETDFFMLNKFLQNILNSLDFKTKIEDNLKSHTLIFLKAIKFSDAFSAQNLMDEVIHCLETQTDLRLWFTIVKENNLSTVLDLCAVSSDFLNAVLKFFDKFSEEMELNYDEEFNVQYSHVNLDFEDFVEIFQQFLKRENLKKTVVAYLASKTLTDKNFCFWSDVKACV